MIRRRCLATLCLLSILSATSHASELNRVVRAIENNLGIRHTRIPMLGMAMFAGRVATGFQMPGVKLAVFDDSGLADRSPQELEQTVADALGPQWSPFVKSTCNHGDEQNWIFLREDGKKAQMFIVAAERGELSLIELKITERQMRKWIVDTDGMARRKGEARSRSSADWD